MYLLASVITADYHPLDDERDTTVNHDGWVVHVTGLDPDDPHATAFLWMIGPVSDLTDGLQSLESLRQSAQAEWMSPPLIQIEELPPTPAHQWAPAAKQFAQQHGWRWPMAGI